MARGLCLFRYGSAIGAMAAALVCAPAMAQGTESPQAGATTASSNDASSDADIIVTAQFRSQRLQDTPIAITAMSAETLEARNQKSVIDIGAYSPNVNLAPATSLYGNAVAAFIRGVGQSNSNFAYEPGVGIYIDDVYYGTTFGAVFDLTDLDHVEVLRGPQGTLAGKNSVGGAIKLFSKKPDDQGGGYLQAAYGKYNRIDLRGSADFTIADGLYARVSGVVKHSEGFVTRLDYGCVHPGQGIPASPQAGGDCKTGSEGGQDMKAIRVALRYAPAGSPLEINIIGDVANDNSENPPTKQIYLNNPNVRSYDPSNPAGGIPLDSRFLTGPHSLTTYASFSNGGNYTTIFGTTRSVAPGSLVIDDKSTSRSYGVSGTIDYEFSPDLSVKSITAYRHAKGYTGVDIDGSPLDVFLEPYDYKHSQFTEELRLTGKVGTLIDYTVGGFYYKANDRLKTRIEIPTYLYDFLGNDPVSNESISAFGHVEVHATDRLNFIGGIRYTHDKKTYTFTRRNLDGTLPSGIPLTLNFLIAGLDGAQGTFKGSRVDWRAGVNYRWNDALMTYAQASTGYKGGGINPIPFVIDQVVPFGPEKLTTYEVGFKADLFDRILRFNGAFFYNDYKGIQLVLNRCTFSTSVTCALPANAGDAHVKGVELEGNLKLAEGLSIDGTLGYLDFQYTNVNAITGVTKDMKAPFNNKWQASSGIQYAWDLGKAGTLTPRLDWTYQSSYYYNAVNGPFNKIAGRSLFNYRATYDSPDKLWALSFSVTNLTNKFYYVGVNDGSANYRMVSGVLGRPREWSLSVRRNF